MKIAVISSIGTPAEELGNYIPPDTTEILSAGGQGLDESITEYATLHSILLTKLNYEKILKQINTRKIDMVLAFWDGNCDETKAVIDICNNLNIPIRVYV